MERLLHAVAEDVRWGKPLRRAAARGAERLHAFKLGFVCGFHNVESAPLFIFRHNIGSTAATVLAAANLVALRQKALKYAIYLTRSTRPAVVRLAAAGVGGSFFCGLWLVWHVPAFAVQLGLYWMLALSGGLFLALHPPSRTSRLFRAPRFRAAQEACAVFV